MNNGYEAEGKAFQYNISLQKVAQAENNVYKYTS